MPHIKNALLRYRIIDKCIRNKYKPYPSKQDLREACEEALLLRAFLHDVVPEEGPQVAVGLDAVVEPVDDERTRRRQVALDRQREAFFASIQEIRDRDIEVRALRILETKPSVLVEQARLLRGTKREIDSSA